MYIRLWGIKMRIITKERFKNIILLLGLFLFTFFINYFSIANNDVIWNYGFSYNVAKGLLMYKSFNMVITPLYPTIFGLFLRIFGNNMLVFYLSNSLIATIIFYIIHKYYRNVFIEMILIVSLVSGPNYNTLCLMFLFILILFEEKGYNDFLIGIILGLVFLTKSSMILLTLASLYYITDLKKIIKRFIGFIVPNVVFIIYFLKKGILKDYINYAFGSLFDFANKNFCITIGIIIFIISIIYLLNEYRKNKKIEVLYILFFQVMSYPIFNYLHIVFSLIPLVFYILKNNNNNIYLKYRKYLLVLLICPVLSTILQLCFIDMDYGTNALKYKLVETKYINDANTIKDNINDLNNTYFVMYEGYYNKLLLGLDVNKYDVMLNGNLGYDGVNETIKYFDSLKHNTKFLIYNDYEGGQAPKQVYYHIKKNYKFVKRFDKYELYMK